MARKQNPRLSDLFKTPKQKTYSLAGITTLTVGVFLLFALRPTFLKIGQLNSEITDKEEFIEKLNTKLETVNFLINEKQSVAEELTFFEEDFPAEKKEGFIVANLAAIADKLDVDLMNVEFKEVEEGEAVPGLSQMDEETDVVYGRIEFRAEGTVSNINKFIEEVESFPRIFHITSLRYAKINLAKIQGDISGYKPFQCNVTLYVFYWGSGEVEEE